VFYFSALILSSDLSRLQHYNASVHEHFNEDTVCLNFIEDFLLTVVELFLVVIFFVWLEMWQNDKCTGKGQ